MFTGLIESIGTIKRSEHSSGSLRLTVNAKFASELKIDQSVSIDGVCQTVIGCDNESFTVVAIPETLERTKFGELKSNDKVNLERGMMLSDRFDGHVVQGHVDGLAQVSRIVRRGDSKEVWLKLPTKFTRYVVEKGSITLAGISLTIAKQRNEECAVDLIPHTLEHTTAGSWRVGTKINFEVDVFAKYIERLLAERSR